MYELLLTGFVPIICWASATGMVCNDPGGYMLYAVRGQEVRLVEQSDRPNLKALPPLEDGFTYVIMQSTTKP